MAGIDFAGLGVCFFFGVLGLCCSVFGFCFGVVGFCFGVLG